MLTDQLASALADGHLAAGTWLLTYALHSTLLLIGAWLVTSRMDARFDAVKESLWKFALVGGVFTATLQTVLPVEPWAGSISLYTAPSVGALPDQRSTHAPPIAEMSEFGTSAQVPPSPETVFPSSHSSTLIQM